MMEFFDKEYLKQNATNVKNMPELPDMAILVTYPCGSKFLYLIWYSVDIYTLCGGNSYVFNPYYDAYYEICKPEDQKD